MLSVYLEQTPGYAEERFHQQEALDAFWAESEF